MKKYWYSFKSWFYYKRYPHYHLKKHNLVMDSLIFIIAMVFLLIIYDNMDLMNEYVLIFIKIGSVFLIITTIISLKYLYRIIKNFKYSIEGICNGYKLIFLFIVLFLLIKVYLNQEQYIPALNQKIDNIKFSYYYPFTASEDDKSKYVESTQQTLKESTTKESWVDNIFSDPEPISDKTMGVENAILKYTNIERKANGLSALEWDSKLAIVARDHSLDMVENDFFSHDNLNGENPTDRAIRQGYNVHKEWGGGVYSDGIAENIGKMPTGSIEGGGYVDSDADSIGEAQVASWMESSGHRANILDSRYNIIGVGCAYDGLYYVCTQNFK